MTRINGASTIRNVHSALCLSPAGGSEDRGTIIVQYFCDRDASRLWIFQSGPYQA